MPININGLGPNSLNTDKARNQDAINKDSTSPAGGKSKAPEDSVKLSAEVKVLKKLESEIQSMSDVDQGKIDRIKSALKNGEYQIDYERLASAMEKFESDLS